MAVGQLELLSPGAFQSLAAGLALAEFGDAAHVMGAGPDGGRDLYVNGDLFWDYDESPEHWNGYTVFQVKHKDKLSDDATQNAAWLWKEVRKELNDWAAWDKAHPRNPLPRQLVFITNVPLTPVQDSGGHDTIQANITKYRNDLNDVSRDIEDEDAELDLAERRKRIAAIKTIRFWDANQLDALVTKHDAVRRRFDGFLTVSDVFATLSEFTGNVAVKDSAPVLLDHARTELLSDGLLYFDQAGERDVRGINVHDVAIDLPVTFPSGDQRSTVLTYVLDRGDNVLARDLSAVDAPRHLVLTGQPGNGKTTISQLIVQVYRVAALKGSSALADRHQAVIDGTESVLAKLRHDLPKNKRWPLRIDLAKYAEERGHKLDENLLRYIADHISAKCNLGDITPATLHAWLHAWPWLVVFDGLDEVTEPETRKRVIERIVEFVSNAEGDGCDLLAIVTTRPAGYTDIDPKMFQTFALDDLTPGEAVRFGIQAAQVRIGAHEDRIAKVVEALEAAARDENLKKLLRTPLQVLILSIIIDGAGTITPDRYGLFRDYYDTVVRRERNKGAMVRNLLTRYEPLIQALHEHAGFDLQVRSETAEHATAVLDESELRDIARRVLDAAEFKADTGDTGVLESIIEAATQRLVLLGPRDGGFGFDVRSLQELMAAQHISNAPLERVVARLRVLAPSPHWRNTWLFAAGKLFYDRREHEYRAVVELVESIDQGAPARLGDYLPIGPDLALDVIDDGMARFWPIWSKRLLNRAVHTLDEPPGGNLDRWLRVLIRYADTGPDERTALVDALRTELPVSGDLRSLAFATTFVPGIEADLGVSEATLGIAGVLEQVQSNLEEQAAPDWTLFQEEIDTSPRSLELNDLLDRAVVALKETRQPEGLTKAQLQDLYQGLDRPEVAAILNAALAHVLPGSDDLQRGLRAVMSARARAAIGDQILD